MGKLLVETLGHVISVLLWMSVVLLLGSGVLALGKLFLYLLGGF